jgi:hypothetical protein
MPVDMHSGVISLPLILKLSARIVLDSAWPSLRSYHEFFSLFIDSSISSNQVQYYRCSDGFLGGSPSYGQFYGVKSASGREGYTNPLHPLRMTIPGGERHAKIRGR